MSSFKPDIVFVINDFQFFLTHRYDLIAHLSKTNRIYVLCNLNGVNHQQIDQIETNQLKIKHLGIARASLNIFKNLWLVWCLFKLLIELKPKQLFLVSFKPIFYGGLIHLFFPFKRVYFLLSGMGFMFITNKAKFKYLKAAFMFFLTSVFKKNNTSVVVQNNDDYHYLLTNNIVSKHKLTLIKGNGINLETFPFKQRKLTKNVKFLFSARLLIDKGLCEYLEAAKHLHKKYPYCEFALCGKYDPINPASLSKNDFETLAKLDYINYLGAIDYKEMATCYLSYDVFVLPSYREGLPKAALEAAATGMPLILTNVPGCREVVLQEKNGYLVNLKDADDLAIKMERFIVQKHLIETFSLESRSYIENTFSSGVIFNQYENLIN